MPATEEEWLDVAAQFGKQCNFPHCIGAIDGRHIEIKKPDKSGLNFLNYQKTFSLVLVAAVNANSEFMMIDLGGNGQFSHTKFLQTLQEATVNMPNEDNIQNTDMSLPYVFVGNEGFPLTENLIKPYSETDLTNEEITFNHRLSCVQRIAENAFGVMSSRFKVLLKRIELRPEKATTIIVACCHLNNFLRAKNSNAYLFCGFDNGNDHSTEETMQEDDWRLNEDQLMILEQVENSNASTFAEDVREQFCEYFNTNAAEVTAQQCNKQSSLRKRKAT